MRITTVEMENLWFLNIKDKKVNMKLALKIKIFNSYYTIKI